MTAIILITLVAALVNGGIGYGFSSITVPVALLFTTNRILNPALVLVEVFANIYVLLMNRKGFARVWRRVATIVVGLIPAIAIGSVFLRSIDSDVIRLATYAFMVPLILLQSFGFRKPLHTEDSIGALFGGVVGLLYSFTTISGPPLAMMLNNEGLEKEDFKAAIGAVRVVESMFTAIVYYYLGFFSGESLSLFRDIAPGVLVAMPVGAILLGRLDAFVFRRICISVDVLLISFGLSRVLITFGASQVLAYLAFAVIVGTDALRLVSFFRARKSEVPAACEPKMLSDSAMPHSDRKKAA